MRLVLVCAQAAYAVDPYRKNATDEAYRWIMDIALPEAMQRAQAASPTERAPWLATQCRNGIGLEAISQIPAAAFDQE